MSHEKEIILPHTPATDAEIASYARGVKTGTMESASSNVVGSLLTRIEEAKFNQKELTQVLRMFRQQLEFIRGARRRGWDEAFLFERMDGLVGRAVSVTRDLTEAEMVRSYKSLIAKADEQAARTEQNTCPSCGEGQRLVLYCPQCQQEFDR